MFLFWKTWYLNIITFQNTVHWCINPGAWFISACSAASETELVLPTETWRLHHSFTWRSTVSQSCPLKNTHTLVPAYTQASKMHSSGPTPAPVHMLMHTHFSIVRFSLYTVCSSGSEANHPWALLVGDDHYIPKVLVHHTCPPPFLAQL